MSPIPAAYAQTHWEKVTTCTRTMLLCKSSRSYWYKQSIHAEFSLKIRWVYPFCDTQKLPSMSRNILSWTSRVRIDVRGTRRLPASICTILCLTSTYFHSLKQLVKPVRSSMYMSLTHTIGFFSSNRIAVVALARHFAYTRYKHATFLHL